jgi:hypothetical protein
MDPYQDGHRAEIGQLHRGGTVGGDAADTQPPARGGKPPQPYPHGTGRRGRVDLPVEHLLCDVAGELDRVGRHTRTGDEVARVPQDGRGGVHPAFRSPADSR